MTIPDRVFARLAELATAELPAEFSASLRVAAHARLRPRRVHRGWTVLIVATVVVYLSWALQFSSSLYS
jgi:hypothetical protein